jgi:hydrogenase maturation protease
MLGEMSRGFYELFDMQTKTKIKLTRGQKKLCQEGRVLVLGAGNILLKDEGIGVHIVREMQRRNMPDYVTLVDAGTAGLDVLLSAEKAEKLIVIDALRAGGKPGTIYKMRLGREQKDKLLGIFAGRGTSGMSLHQIGLIEALSIVDKMQCAPEEIVVIGVEPEEFDYGLELTNSVKRKILKIINAVLEEIEDAVYE